MIWKSSKSFWFQLSLVGIRDTLVEETDKVNCWSQLSVSRKHALLVRQACAEDDELDCTHVANIKMHVHRTPNMKKVVFFKVKSSEVLKQRCSELSTKICWCYDWKARKGWSFVALFFCLSLPNARARSRAARERARAFFSPVVDLKSHCFKRSLFWDRESWLVLVQRTHSCFF